VTSLDFLSLTSVSMTHLFTRMLPLVWMMFEDFLPVSTFNLKRGGPWPSQSNRYQPPWAKCKNE